MTSEKEKNMMPVRNPGIIFDRTQTTRYELRGLEAFYVSCQRFFAQSGVTEYTPLSYTCFLPAVIFGGWNDFDSDDKNAFRNEIYNKTRKIGANLLVFSKPHAMHPFEYKVRRPYYQVTKNHFCPTRCEFNLLKPDTKRIDLLDAVLDFEIATATAPSDEHVSILIEPYNLDYTFGRSTRDTVIDLVTKTMANTDRKIKIFANPINSLPRYMHYGLGAALDELKAMGIELEVTQTLRDIAAAHCVVTESSPASMYSYFKGVPVVSECENNYLTFKNSTYKFSEIDSITKQEMNEDMMADYSYRVWSGGEIADRTMSKHLLHDLHYTWKE